MGSTRALLLAGAVALGVANAAHAADLPLPPPPAYFPPPEPVAYGGWYLRGDVGAGLSFSPDIRSSFFDGNGGALSTCDALYGGAGCPYGDSFGRDRQKMGDVGFVDFGVGYDVNHWLRFDVTGEVRSEARFSTTEHYIGSYSPDGITQIYANPGSFSQDNYSGSVQSSVFLANAYVDLGTWYGMTPYIGGGVGAVYNHMSALTDSNPGTLVTFTDGTQGTPGGGSIGYAPARGKWNLAYAGMFGFSYDLTSNLKLDIGYRYLNMGQITSADIVCSGSCTRERQKLHLSSNDIRVGLRWLINDYTPLPQPELPIIRKD